MNMHEIRELAAARARLMEKYRKGVITEEEMRLLDAIEHAVDEILKQRRKGV